MHFEHVTIRAKSLLDSIAFYEEVVGLKLVRDMRHHAPIVFLENEEGATRVELIADGTAYTGSGISLGFHTENVEEKHTALTQKGFQPTPIITPNPHTKFFFIVDPNGVEIQFIN